MDVEDARAAEQAKRRSGGLVHWMMSPGWSPFSHPTTAAVLPTNTSEVNSLVPVLIVVDR